MSQSIDDRKTEETRQAYKLLLGKRFPTITTVHEVHQGPNRAQRRAWKFMNGGKSNGKPANTQRPAFF